MLIDEKKLDNPVWYSLEEVHNKFSLQFDGARFYKPDYCSFGGFSNLNNLEKAIEDYSLLIEDFYVVGNNIPTHRNISLKRKELHCNQMVLKSEIILPRTERVYELKT